MYAAETGAFLEQQGLLVVEAEHRHSQVDRNGRSWVERTDRSGYAGSGAMLAEPDTGATINSTYATTSPELRYQVQFATTGTYYVWLRGWADDAGANSIHVGLDGQAVASADRINISSTYFGTWKWVRNTLDGVIATLTIPSAGLHTINVWMREDGFRLDRVLLTTDSAYRPSGAGPTESPREGEAATRLFSWRTLAPSPIGRFEAQGAAVNGKLYVFGGFYNTDIQATARSDVYDPVTNSWQQIADMPEVMTHSPVVVDGTTVYLVGGFVGDHPGPSTTHVWRYETTTDTWSRAPDLPEPRGSGAAVRLGRNLHFFAGTNRTSGRMDDKADHYVLALDGGTAWTTLAPVLLPRNHLGGVVLNGKIYAIGGQQQEEEATSNQTQVEVYDPATNTWSRVADLPVPRGHITSSVFVLQNRILVIGGSTNGGSGGVGMPDVTAYDPQTNVWIKLPPLPDRRKTPVADLIGDQVLSTTGSRGGPTTITWGGIFPESWEIDAALPVALGEVAGGIIGNKLYLVGQGSSATLAYTLSTGLWGAPAALAVRPFAGHHHAAEVLGGRLYLFGGFGNSSPGKVQIYNPATNTWSRGADMPFAAGSSSSAVIGGEIYVAGGIIGTATTTQVAKYNPATDRWTALAPMPQGRNHTAAATDGTKLYIFGGRGPGSGDSNVVANGFDTVQIYDPATDTWVSSEDPGSTLAPLPQARGGMGKAVYFNGEFYVLGGETRDGAGATAQGVYNRVDIYNPRTNTWRLGTPMPTARHGIFPLLIAGRIYVGGGGVQAGSSASASLEIYNPR